MRILPPILFLFVIASACSSLESKVTNDDKARRENMEKAHEDPEINRIAVKLLAYHKTLPKVGVLGVRFEDLKNRNVLSVAECENLQRYSINGYRVLKGHSNYAYRFLFSFPPNDAKEFVREAAPKTSVDLTEDRKLMWQTTAVDSQNPKASTDDALDAAERVFNTVNLVGLTESDVLKTLGDPKQESNSIYNFPFFPVSKNTMVYRFDTGNYGWQFNLNFADKKVSKVQKLWIH